MLRDSQRDESTGTELSFENTQPTRPQHFYADLDSKLDGLNRDEYIKELLHICRKDFSMLTNYEGD